MLQNGQWCSVAVQVLTEPENYQGTGLMLLTDAGIRVHDVLQICLECRSQQKP
jgi:hypothetical protein